MNSVLIVWILLTLLCSIYTLVLPSWDSYTESRSWSRETNRVNELDLARNSAGIAN